MEEISGYWGNKNAYKEYNIDLERVHKLRATYSLAKIAKEFVIPEHTLRRRYKEWLYKKGLL
jgi:hypothetical protein